MASEIVVRHSEGDYKYAKHDDQSHEAEVETQLKITIVGTCRKPFHSEPDILGLAVRGVPEATISVPKDGVLQNRREHCGPQLCSSCQCGVAAQCIEKQLLFLPQDVASDHDHP